MLDTLSAPLCDAVLESSGSGRTLAELARSNALLISLDRTGDSYRYHGLFAQMLRAELRRLEPRRESPPPPAGERLVRLARRAAPRDPARGGGGRRAGRGRPAVGRCPGADRPRAQRHGRELAEGVQRASRSPAPRRSRWWRPSSRLAAGAGAEAERWAAAATHRVAEAPRRARDSLRAAALLPAAVAAREGLAGMCRAAARARELGPDDGPVLSTCNLLEGVARHLAGDPDGARDPLEAGARGGAAATPNIQALCLAQLALLLVHDDEWDRAASLASRARSSLEGAGLGSYPTSALVFAVSGLVRAHRGWREEAHKDTRQAARLLSCLDDFAPWYEAETRLVLARAALRLGHVTDARALTTEAARVRGRNARTLRSFVNGWAPCVRSSTRQRAPRRRPPRSRRPSSAS